jgi:hypothetical protein
MGRAEERNPSAFTLFISKIGGLGLEARSKRWWAQPTLRVGVCIRNSLESLFVKEGTKGSFGPIAHRGVQRSKAPLRYS